MRHAFLFIFIFFNMAKPAPAAEAINDIEQMGTLAGVVLACGGKNQLRTFENIVSRYISNTSPNEAFEKDAENLYARAKASSYLVERDKKNVPCQPMIAAFSQMPIFKFELYEDGSLKTPDGKYLLPRGQKAFNPKAARIYPEPAQPAARR